MPQYRVIVEGDEVGAVEVPEDDRTFAEKWWASEAAAGRWVPHFVISEGEVVQLREFP